MVPSLSAQNLQSTQDRQGLQFNHGYIKRDFDVDEWARPEFLEKAVQEVLKEEWAVRSWSKLPQGGGLEGRRHAARVTGTEGRVAARRRPLVHSHYRLVTSAQDASRKGGRRRASGLRPSHQRDRSHPCAVFSTLFLLGPRAAIIIWWIAQPGRWDAAFSSWLWPLIGFFIAPWTTLMWAGVTARQR